MLQDVWTLLTTRWDFFGKLLLEHIEISLAAILIAIVFGALIGILISEYQKSAKPTLGVINFLYTIPSISMLGFLIPFSGIGNGTAVIALTLYALLPTVQNTYTGMINVDPVILEAAKGMGSTKKQILFRVQLPLAMPMILSGIRNMVTMTIALAGIASFIGAGGLGGTSNIEPAMESGKFDLYPEYTGTGWNMVLKRDSLYSEDQFEELQKEYRDKLNLTWDVMLGFNDTYGIAVRKEIADQYGLKTYSDLQKINVKLAFGAEYDFFERQDGYDKLCST